MGKDEIKAFLLLLGIIILFCVGIFITIDFSFWGLIGFIIIAGFGLFISIGIWDHHKHPTDSIDLRDWWS